MGHQAPPNIWGNVFLYIQNWHTKLKFYMMVIYEPVPLGAKYFWTQGSTPALLPPLTGSARRVIHEEIGCNKWKKRLAYLLVLPGSRARIVRCGGRYDPQLVKRSSE